MGNLTKGFCALAAIVAILLGITLSERSHHAHVWDYALRTCAECGAAQPCWNESAGRYVHIFGDDGVCAGCGAVRYCGQAGHPQSEAHALASCGVPGHFACDGLSHEAYPYDPDVHTQCLEPVMHECDECGRAYTCDYANSHVRCDVCGAFWCYKEHGDHTEAPCGHRYCQIYGDEDGHRLCESCGGYLCDGMDHELCSQADSGGTVS